MFANNTGRRRDSVKRTASTDLTGNNNKNPKTQYSIPTSNRFSALPNDAAKSSAKKPPLPAPVIITDGTNPSDILSELKIAYKLKVTSIGTKIFTENAKDFSLLGTKLSEHKIEFFSHAPASNKSFKLVLHGLPEFPINEIVDNLNSQYNVKVEKIIMLKSEGSLKRYLVHFDSKENSKSDITNIRSILNHIIKWLPAKRFNRGPTQCLNCGMYGHGISACFRKPKCFLCAGDHDTKNCTFQSTSNDQRVFKCHYCRANNLAHNHRANDLQCPARAKYIEIKTNASKKGGTVSDKHYVPTTDAFPPLPPPPLSRSFAEAAKSQHESNNRRTHNSTNSGELFTFAEISKIMLDCVNDLQKCSNKLDQLKVVANLLNHAFK